MEKFYLTKPWDHQKLAVETAKDLDEYALFFEMGTGKTKTLIDLIRYKFSKHGRLMNTLILSPPITLENWKREILTHSKIREKDIVILRGSDKKRSDTISGKIDMPRIYITNYEVTQMSVTWDIIRKNVKPEILGCDESHKLKSMKAKRTKQVIKLAKETRYRYLLTGTPILKDGMDLFSQFRILDKGTTFGTDFMKFKQEYFYDKNANIMHLKFPNWVPKPKSEEILNKKIDKISMHVEKSECLDLPPYIKQVYSIEMSTKQAKAYKDMERDFVAYLNDQACVAELAVTKGLRLQQIVSGFMNTDDGEIVHFKDNPRKDGLKELLEKLTPNHKVIIWAVFKENYKDIEQVCEDLKLEFTAIHGGINDKDKIKNMDRFNNDDTCRVLYGHPLSGGIGINLIEASYSIFYSRNFSLENDLQAEARNYRGGSEKHKVITRIDLVSKNTIDEEIQKRLALKMSISDKIIKEVAIDCCKNKAKKKS